MVFLTKNLLSYARRTKRRIKFIDQVRVYVRGGGGGQGQPQYGGPGGNGGSVYLRCDKNMTLKKLKGLYPRKRFIGGSGGNSSRSVLQGAKGEDIFVKIPEGISVIDDSGKKLGDLNEDGQQILAVRGGYGGNHGNQWEGQRGQAKNLNLVLKLIADVGFVGFPNAGKSTLLQALSRAEPKIADYPFTTVSPQIGMLEYDDLRQISMSDLPGLIEGAHYNVGMGHKFLRHVERTKLLLFVVDLCGFRLASRYSFRSAFETVMLLNRELELYKPDLVDKPALLALNKIDVEGTDEIVEETLHLLEEASTNPSPETTEESNSRNIYPTQPIQFKDKIVISAARGDGLELLKMKIREVIDEEDEEQKLGNRKMGRVS